MGVLPIEGLFSFAGTGAFVRTSKLDVLTRSSPLIRGSSPTLQFDATFRCNNSMEKSTTANPAPSLLKQTVKVID